MSRTKTNRRTDREQYTRSNAATARPDDQTQPTFEMTPGFKPFTSLINTNKQQEMKINRISLTCDQPLKEKKGHPEDKISSIMRRIL